MLAAGRHYLEKQGKSTGIPERLIVATAIQSLGLEDITPFDPDEKIIEYRLARERQGLVDLTVTGFADLLSTDAPAPGGGSVAALCGALSASLSAMVGNLTHGRKGQEDVWEEMGQLSDRAQEKKAFLLDAVDRDTDSFNRVMDAMRIRAKTDEEKAEKDAALREANRGATLVPLEVLEACPELVALARVAAEKGNPNSVSDAGVGGLVARSCAEGAYYNVLINLQGLEGDEEWAAAVRERAETAVTATREAADELARVLADRLA
jgi:glutamate formiminotransferase/formiminotetrahydrofolate cyclodeaminase